MNDDDKRIQRNNLKKLRSQLEEVMSTIDSQIGSLCHRFSEDDLIALGWVKASYSGTYMAYEYKKNNKYIVFLDKSGDVVSYHSSPNRFFEDLQELIEYSK